VERTAGVRRQRRGVERMGQILDAAVTVFSRDGVERATTNAIATEAGISPGSLYQFFDDKSHIARALGERYATAVTAAHRAALAEVDLAGLPMPQVLDRILDPIVAFKDEHRAFVTLFARPDLPESLVGPAATVDEAFAARITEILQERNPGRSPAELRTAADTMISLFRGVVGTLGSASGDPDADLVEVKLALLGYLQIKDLR
jgi:AcrR family transcriptional regulator